MKRCICTHELGSHFVLKELEKVKMRKVPELLNPTPPKEHIEGTWRQTNEAPTV